MRKAIIAAVGVLAFLAGCGNQADKAKVPVEPKWKGAPYRLALDTKPAKPNPAGVTIPGIKFTANPESLEKRAILVIRFDDLGTPKYQPRTNKMILAPVDISGAEGALPADYIATADKDFGTFAGSNPVNLCRGRSAFDRNPLKLWVWTVTLESPRRLDLRRNQLPRRR